MDPNTRSPCAQQKLAEIESRIEQLQKANPEMDVKADLKWWVPTVDLGDVLNMLDKETNEKLNASIAKMLECNFAPEVVATTREEVKTILAEYPEIQKRVDTGVFGNELGLARAHESLTKAAEAGNGGLKVLLTKQNPPSS
ncbi:hypothetical protein BDV12DRAFT_203457 [Aspergillus spectabilis]